MLSRALAIRATARAPAPETECRAYDSPSLGRIPQRRVRIEPGPLLDATRRGSQPHGAIHQEAGASRRSCIHLLRCLESPPKLAPQTNHGDSFGPRELVGTLKGDVENLGDSRGYVGASQFTSEGGDSINHDSDGEPATRKNSNKLVERSDGAKRHRVGVRNLTEHPVASQDALS